MDKGNETTPTSWIWTVPIFLGLLGGILTYIALKDYSQEKANDAIMYGILSTMAIIFFCVVLWVFVLKNTIPFPV